VAKQRLVLFIHGWSVTHTNTYGGLPERLRSEAQRDSTLQLDIRHLYLGRFVSFHDEVRMADLARAFEEAVQRELGKELAKGTRFVAITHSTGGPVVRDWWDRYYVQKRKTNSCPMSHLIMLAPANFGSALAQLGKGRIGRLQAWVEDLKDSGTVEPGTGVLDWLELGSPEAWELNSRWFDYHPAIGAGKVFPFVLTGQSIDREFYDHLNTYTGEIGSDGVVRAAAANLNASYVRLVQAMPTTDGGKPLPAALRNAAAKRAPPTAFALLPGMAHSGDSMGILRSVRDTNRPHVTVTAILRCLRVQTDADYAQVCGEFAALTQKTEVDERLETEAVRLLPDRQYIHDPHSMVIARVQDDTGRLIGEFDLLLTGRNDSPDLLPENFLADRQRNKRHPGTLTFYLNYAAMVGTSEVKNNEGKVCRATWPGATALGFILRPAIVPTFVQHAVATLKATRERLNLFIRPHETTMVDIVLRRIVRRGAFELSADLKRKSFSDQEPGDAVDVES
jgi:hypothetical protein